MTRSAVIDRDADTRAADPRHGPPRKRGSGGDGPERVTVNLIPRASKALHDVSELTGDTKTDSINRALQVYAYLEQIMADGGDIYVREPKDSEPRLLKMF